MCLDGKNVDSYGYTSDEINQKYVEKVAEFEPYKEYEA